MTHDSTAENRPSDETTGSDAPDDERLDESGTGAEEAVADAFESADKPESK